MKYRVAVVCAVALMATACGKKVEAPATDKELAWEACKAASVRDLKETVRQDHEIQGKGHVVQWEQHKTMASIWFIQGSVKAKATIPAHATVSMQEHVLRATYNIECAVKKINPGEWTVGIVRRNTVKSED